MIDGQSLLFDQHMGTFKIATGQGDEYTTAFLLDYSYFEENYRIIPVDLRNNKHLMQIRDNTAKEFY